MALTRVTVAVVLVAGVLMLVAVSGAATPNRFGWEWAAILLLNIVVQRFPVSLRAGGESLHLVISEVPLVLGLFFLSPVELVVARVAGLLAHELAYRKRDIKVLVTTATYALEAAVALAVFWSLLGATSVPGTAPLTLVIALFAVVSSTTVGSVVTWAAIGFAVGEFERTLGSDLLRVSLPVSVVNAACSLIAVVLIRREPTATWLLLIPAVILVLGYRRYIEERERREFLGMLYGLSREIHAANDLESACEVFTRALREHIGAARVELYLQRAGGHRWSMVASKHDDTRSGLRRLDAIPSSVTRSLALGEPVREYDEAGRCTTVTSAMDLGRDRHLALVAREPASDVGGFHGSAERALAAVAAHARAALEDVEFQEAKASFLSSVSHELRTPLSVVLGVAETLNEQSEHLTDDVTAVLTQRLHAQARRLDGLLQDLLDVDRLGRGLLEPTWSRVDVGALVARCARALDIRTHDVAIDTVPVEAVVDASACERIVENLVVNAAKYSPPGGRIDIAVQPVGDDVTIVVQDQGPGIPDRDRSRVFELFTRLDDSHPSPGTGVGLSLVNRLVSMQDGSVEVTDGAVGGARFVVTLPRAEDLATSSREPLTEALRA